MNVNNVLKIVIAQNPCKNPNEFSYTHLFHPKSVIYHQLFQFVDRLVNIKLNSTKKRGARENHNKKNCKLLSFSITFAPVDGSA